MGRSRWMPSIVIDNVSRLGRVWREAEAEHSDVEARRPMARPDLAIAFPVAIGAKAPFSGFVRPELASSDWVERAKAAAKQMRYFGLVARKSSFSEMLPSARRAGFALLN